MIIASLFEYYLIYIICQYIKYRQQKYSFFAFESTKMLVFFFCWIKDEDAGIDLSRLIMK